MATEPDGLAPGSLERFWAWWATAKDRLAAAIDKQTLSKQIAMEVSNAVDSLHPSFVWELAPGRAARHALTLSPEGDVALRRLTATWLRSAPPPDQTWEYHAARQPAPHLNLLIDGLEFSPADFSIAYEYDNLHERFQVALHHPRFDHIPDDVRRQVAFLTLDQFLGEDEVERWLGAIDVAPTSPARAVPLNEFTAEMDRRRARATGGRFSLGHAYDRDGHAAVVMLNTALKQIDHLDHVFHLAVFVRLRAPQEDGLPSGDEAEQLNDVEDRLVELLGDNAVHIGRLTLAGRREVHFYVRDPDAAEDSIAVWRTGAGAWAMNHVIEADPAWGFADDGFYAALAPGQT
jgi:hypothetical protein